MHKPPPAPGHSTATAHSLDAEVAVEDDRWRSHPEIEIDVQRAIAALLSCQPELVRYPAAVTIVLSDDSRVAALNGDFRARPQPTNVLSFPAHESATEPGSPPYLGDIIIARETVEREAGDAGIPVSHHLQHLTIHGLLHLLGYDHQSSLEAELMEAVETRVLHTLGIADPYTETSDKTSPATTQN